MHPFRPVNPPRNLLPIPNDETPARDMRDTRRKPARKKNHSSTLQAPNPKPMRGSAGPAHAPRERADGQRLSAPDGGNGARKGGSLLSKAPISSHANRGPGRHRAEAPLALGPRNDSRSCAWAAASRLSRGGAGASSPRLRCARMHQRPRDRSPEAARGRAIFTTGNARLGAASSRGTADASGLLRRRRRAFPFRAAPWCPIHDDRPSRHWFPNDGWTGNGRT